MGEYLEWEDENNVPIYKDPLFSARYAVTTIDSLVYNAFRVPVTELYTYRKHYAIPRSRLFVSALYLDEVHSIIEDIGGYDNRQAPYTVLMSLLDIANAARIPVILASATVPRSLKDAVRKKLRDSVVVELGREGSCANPGVITVRDKDFENNVLNIRWKTQLVSKEDAIKTVVEQVRSGRRVFVACDTIRSAVDFYQKISKELSQPEVELLHSMFTRADRARKLDRARQKEVKVLVATSVVEAGVDISFDSLVTEGGNPFSVIQRVGRVCRSLNCNEVEVRIIKEDANQALIDFISKANKPIAWRLPYDTDGAIGYSKLLEELRNFKEDNELKRTLRGLLFPLVVDSTTINKMLGRVGGGFLRMVLANIVVKAWERDISEISYEGLLNNSITADLDRVNKLAKEKCIEGLYAILEEQGCLRAEEIGSQVTNPKEYIELMRRAYSNYQWKLVIVAFLCRPECYSSSLGAGRWGATLTGAMK